MRIGVMIAVILALILLPFPVYASSIQYNEYTLNNIRVIIVDAHNASYSFTYCGVNYIDLNLSDDYAVLGPQSIPGIEKKSNVMNLSLLDIAEALKNLKEYTVWYNDTQLNSYVPMAILKPNYGVVEIIVKPDVDPVNASRPIAEALSDLMLSKGYDTLIIVRPVSDLSPSELNDAFNKVSSIVLGAVQEPPEDAPLYLQQIIKLQRAAIENSTGETYISVGLGAYGSIGIEIWGPQPTVKDLEEIAKWIRDRTGECTAPLYIEYNGPTPLKADLDIGMDTPGESTYTDHTPEINTAVPNTILLVVVSLVVALMSSVFWKIYI
ncbi:MAG: hypothetical protein GSR81_05360 [Desulfurococcales archaeon]|nr:hypothetical protein [Desulfurococcales archaeon]